MNPLTSRRAVLAGSAGIIAATLTADAVAGSGGEFWPEFVEWQRLAIELRDYFAGPGKTADDETFNEFLEARSMQMHPLVDALFARPVRGFADVIAIGCVAVFYNSDERLPPLAGPIDECDEFNRGDSRSAAALVRAVGIVGKASGLEALANADFDLVMPARPDDMLDGQAASDV